MAALPAWPYPLDSLRLAAVVAHPMSKGLRSDVHPARLACLVENGQGSDARVDRAAVAAALAAVVACAAAVVVPRVDRHRERIRMHADVAATSGDRHRRELLRPRCHLIATASGCVLQRRRLGQGLGVALHAEESLDALVERRDLVVGERPIAHVGAGKLSEQGLLLEVDVPEPRHLRIPVHGAATDDCGELVDVADLTGLARAAPEHAW